MLIWTGIVWLLAIAEAGRFASYPEFEAELALELASIKKSHLNEASSSIAPDLAPTLTPEEIGIDHPGVSPEVSTRDQFLQEEVFIIQISPETTIKAFLQLYPSLAYRIDGQLRIGSFQAIHGKFDRRLTRYLAYSKLVLDVSRDVTVKIYDVQTHAPRHLARLSQKEPLADDGPYDYVYDPTGGFGVDVYVFDTGIGEDAFEFETRVRNGKDFTGEGHGDENGHGTCVAGVIGSRTYGVAKKVNMIEVKVVKQDGKGKLSWVLNGLDYVLKSRERSNRPSIINMSLGTPRNTMFNKAVQQAIEMDIPIVTAAGNSDTSACRVSPASAENSFTVGAFDDRSETVASFSNWGQCVDVFAPGVNIQSVKLQGDDDDDEQYVLYSGTSVACPVGTGLVAYFMSMGDSGTKAVQRAKDLRVRGKLSRSTLVFKPLTENLILYNEAGEPLW